jgi:hypothetical protein
MKIEKVLCKTKKADLTFFYNGKINITAHVSHSLGLNAGDAVNIAKVENGWTEYYLYIERRANEMRGQYEGVCAVTHGDGHNLRVFNCRLSRYILALCGTTEPVSLSIGEPEEVEGLGLAVPIIIRPLPTPSPTR